MELPALGHNISGMSTPQDYELFEDNHYFLLIFFSSASEKEENNLDHLFIYIYTF